MDSIARRYRRHSLSLLIALVLSATACGGKAPEGPTEEERQAEAMRMEQERLDAEEQALLDAEDKAMQEAGTAKASSLPPPPPTSYPPGILYEKAFPEDFRRVTPVRIGILSSPNRPQAGQHIALLLGGVQRKRLELKLRKPIRVAFVSRSKKRHKPKTVIGYRPDFLIAAIEVARVIADKQDVRPMNEREEANQQVDIFVYVGASVR